MTNPNELADRYVTLWNEPDAEQRRRLIEELWTEDGGQILQPVLYGLAAERLLGRSVVAGRLYFCTADGGFQERVVALDGTARAATQEVAGIIGAALEAGFLPAAPAEGACKWCDYRPVCGPWEEFRTSRKPANGLAGLKRLRGME